MSGKVGAAKKSKSKSKQQKCLDSGQKAINDIIKKIVDTHSEADRRLAEMSSLCFEKNCKVK